MPDFPYARVRRAARPARHPRRRARRRSARAWDEALAADRPVRARGDRRPGGAAAAAAHHARAGEDFAQAMLQAATRTRGGMIAAVAAGRWSQASLPRAGDGRRRGAAVERLDVAAYTIPTDAPGVGRHARVGLDDARRRRGRAPAARRGLGYTYARRAPRRADRRACSRRRRRGRDALDVAAALGGDGAARCATSAGPGIASMAISAVDVALWDLKARLLGAAAGRRCSARARDAVPVYGSGGFTSYSRERLREQLGGWVARRASRA